MGTELPWVLADEVAALVAALAAALRARACRGRQRLVWILVAIGCGIRATAQSLRSWYEIGLGLDPSFPSMPDVAFLGFVVVTCVGLLVYPFADQGSASLERVLDAAMTAVVLGFASWVLINALRSPSQDGLGIAVLISYPLADVLVLVLAVLARTRATLSTLIRLGAGVIVLSVADGMSAYLSLYTRSLETTGIVELGWVAGFALIVLAALRIGQSEPDRASESPTAVSLGLQSLRTSGRGLRRSLVAYLSVAVALGVTIAQTARGVPLSIGELALVTAVVGLALVRQYLNVRRNATLTQRLEIREAQLQQKAFHDGMTALPNRGLFRDRLQHALQLHARDRSPVSVLFLDLDDFKTVNDTMGHARGDDLLVRVSERLIGAVRAGDTVARLGGDEFAILLENCTDPLPVAQKIHDVLRVPFVLEDAQIDVGASLGVFSLDAADKLLTADALLSRADTAMYAAKRSGKSRIVAYQDENNLIQLHRK